MGRGPPLVVPGKRLSPVPFSSLSHLFGCSGFQCTDHPSPWVPAVDTFPCRPPAVPCLLFFLPTTSDVQHRGHFLGAHPHLPEDRHEPGTRDGYGSSHQWTRQPPPPSRHSWMNLMHSLKCCSLQGERQGGEDGRAAHTCEAPGHTSSRSCAPPPFPTGTSHHPGATGVGWEQRSFLCQTKAEGLIFTCQEGNDLGDFPGISCFPRYQDGSRMPSGKPAQEGPQGDSLQGKVSSCAQGTHTSPRQRLS